MTDAEIRARNAAQLLENPLLEEALSRLEKEAIDAWVGSNAEDTFQRERQWIQVKLVRRLREYLQTAIDDGRFETNRATRRPLP